MAGGMTGITIPRRRSPNPFLGTPKSMNICQTYSEDVGQSLGRTYGPGFLTTSPSIRDTISTSAQKLLCGEHNLPRFRGRVFRSSIDSCDGRLAAGALIGAVLLPAVAEAERPAQRVAHLVRRSVQVELGTDQVVRPSDGEAYGGSKRIWLRATVAGRPSSSS